MKLNNQRAVLFVAIVVILLVTAGLSVPIWLQSMYLDGMRTQYKLKAELNKLQDSLSVADKQIAELQSLQRMEALAPKLGLNYHQNPIKVLEIPATGAKL